MSQNVFKTRGSINSVPQGDERTTLRLYLKHADTLFRHYDEWKGIDRFYFIPVRLNMAYFCAGGTTAVAFPPYFIGTVLRNTLEHPELFSAKCQCGHTAYAYSYSGSPLSGRFDLSCACPHCGAHTGITQQGWWVRSKALRATQSSEALRIAKIRLLRPRFVPASIQELLHHLGVPEEDLILPPEDHKISRTPVGGGWILVSDSAGGSVLVKE